MEQKNTSSVGKMVEKLDSTTERLRDLESFVDENPEYSELAPYLRIALASLRTAVGIYGEPLEITLSAEKLTSEAEIEQGASGAEG